MINTSQLTAVERSQLETKELARGAWREGQTQNALLILGSITAEEMSPRVAGEVFVTEAAFRSELGDFAGSLESLQRAGPFIDECGLRVRGSFYLQRGLAKRRLGDIDGALTDYAGAASYWEELGETDYQIAALINLAELYLKTGDLEQAGEHIDSAFRVLTPGSTHYGNAHDTKARVLLAEGDLAGAAVYSRLAVQAAGDNEGWKTAALETQDRIKAQIVDLAAHALTIKDLTKLKREMIERALETSGGSVVEAARLLETSHQVVAYTAKENGLTRTAPRVRRKSIIKISS